MTDRVTANNAADERCRRLSGRIRRCDETHGTRFAPFPSGHQCFDDDRAAESFRGGERLVRRAGHLANRNRNAGPRDQCLGVVLENAPHLLPFVSVRPVSGAT